MNTSLTRLEEWSINQTHWWKKLLDDDSDILKTVTAPSSLFYHGVVHLKHIFFYLFLSLSLSNHAGIIRTALANMDREAREHYTVVIQAKDMAGQVGGLSGSTTINITLTDINDNPPKFPQSKYSFICKQQLCIRPVVPNLRPRLDCLVQRKNTIV